jgi:hypothetical protein
MSSRLVIVLRQPNSKPHDVSVDAERALVGSGAHCEVQLLQEDAASEHLMLEVRNGAVIGQARCLRPEPLLNGAPFGSGRILPDSVLRIGRVEMTVTVGTADAKVASAKQGMSSTRVFAIAALALAASAYFVTMNDGREGAITPPPDPPALWAAEDVSCPRHNAEAAAASADDLRLAANGKRERSPFSPQDGVAAVPLYRRAAACLGSVGKTTDAQEAGLAAEHLQAKMLDEYHIQRVGLDRSLVDQDWEGARKHVHVLLSFLGGRSGDYVEWLSNVDRRLQIKISTAKPSLLAEAAK